MNTQLKLYTFTIKDSYNYSAKQIENFAFDMCVDNAPFFGWAPGFRVELENTVIHEEGQPIYTANVYGEFLEGAGPLDDESAPIFNQATDRFVASPPSL